MMKPNRGVVFGTMSTSGMGNRMRRVNPFRTLSNMPTQFGRSLKPERPTLYGKTRRVRRS